jgi:hypothetical protein
MAIADVAEYAHLSAADVEALAVELDAIRLDIEDSRGANDRAYIQRTIAVQRFPPSVSTTWWYRCYRVNWSGLKRHWRNCTASDSLPPTTIVISLPSPLGPQRKPTPK